MTKKALLFLFLLWVGGSAAAGPPVRSIFLVAAEKLGDPNFSRSVVLVTRHGSGGPIGVILNRPTDTAMSAVFPDAVDLPPGATQIYFGGPVARRTIVYLFRASTPPSNNLEVLPGIYLSFDAEMLSDLLRAEGPKSDLRVFAGHAGWAPDQLENEIARGDWHPIPADADFVFRRETEKLWLDLIERASARSVREEGPPTPTALPVRRLASRD